MKRLRKNNVGFTLVELMAVLIVLGIVAIIAYPVATKNINKSKEKAYETQVNEIVQAARRWAVEHESELPEIGSQAQIGVKIPTLLKGYLTNSSNGVIYNPKDKSKTMDGCVIIEYSLEYNQYLYNYDENCNIKIPGVADILKEQYNESNTVGLLKDTDGSYYYKGTKEEVSNNFVWFAGHLWRVISIDSENNLTMITQQPLTAIQPASAVWDTKEKYDASYINHWLNSETDGVFYKSLTQEDKDKILNSTFNVGIYTNVSEITTSQKVGLLDETQYTKAGEQNSFLDIKDRFWLGNRYSSSTARIVGNYGTLYYYGPSTANGVRPVIKISNLTFTGGKGTLDDPYRESSTTTSTSDIKVGEYISIPTSGNDCGEDKRCLFRVVSKDSNSIKVILNGLLPSTSAFGSSPTYTSGNTIDTKVKAFAETINVNYHYSGTDKTFGIGMYPSSATNYTAVQTPTYQGNVGLPVVGEMFSGNDIDVTTSPKTFVNVNTIENPTVSDYFWTMNAYDTSFARGVYDIGVLSYIGPATAFGVRPVVILNASSSLTFASGEGTAENPFMLGE